MVFTLIVQNELKILIHLNKIWIEKIAFISFPISWIKMNYVT